MKINHNGKMVEIKCSMCGNEEPEFIAPETNEPLCEKCAIINENIKRDYPNKLKYKLRRITKEDIPLIIKTLNKLKAIE